jgi:YD repeat-containing protein
MMTSQVYTPLHGVSSSTDARGRITYYQYDAFGRNIVVKDQEGNVVSKKEYHVAQ